MEYIYIWGTEQIFKFGIRLDTDHLHCFYFCVCSWSSLHGSAVTNRTNTHESMGLIPGLAQWVKDLMLP